MAMRTKRIFRVHNAGWGLPIGPARNGQLPKPFILCDGLHELNARALLMTGGVTILPGTSITGPARGILEFHERTDSGPDEVVTVDVGPNGDMYSAILAKPGLVRRITNACQHEGWKIQFFSTAVPEWELYFLNQLGLDWSHVVSPPPRLAAFANDKGHQRELAGQLGCDDVFPEHAVCHSPLEALNAFNLLRTDGEVVAKLMSWASGMGMIFGRSRRKLLLWMLKHYAHLDRVVIERSFGADHVAMSFVQRYEDGQKLDEWWTEQGMARTNGTLHPTGIIVARTLPNVTAEDVQWMRETSSRMTASFLREAPGFNGVICWDGIKAIVRGIPRRALTECNMRETESSYVRAWMHGRAELLGCDVNELIGIIHPVEPVNVPSFTALEGLVRDQLCSKEQVLGVAPVFPARLRYGRCKLIATARSTDAAWDMLRACGTQVGDRTLAQV